MNHKYFEDEFRKSPAFESRVLFFKKLISNFDRNAALAKGKSYQPLQKKTNICYPLGFRKPMLLSHSEKAVIDALILNMALVIKSGDYGLHPDVSVLKISVNGEDETLFENVTQDNKNILINAQVPHIGDTWKELHPGFYMIGKFKRDKVFKEIHYAELNKISVFEKQSETERVIFQFRPGQVTSGKVEVS